MGKLSKQAQTLPGSPDLQVCAWHPLAQAPSNLTPLPVVNCWRGSQWPSRWEQNKPAFFPSVSSPPETSGWMTLTDCNLHTRLHSIPGSGVARGLPLPSHKMHSGAANHRRSTFTLVIWKHSLFIPVVLTFRIYLLNWPKISAKKKSDKLIASESHFVFHCKIALLGWSSIFHRLNYELLFVVVKNLIPSLGDFFFIENIKKNKHLNNSHVIKVQSPEPF